MTLSGCIDNNYDLSDIDKTTQISVNDLTLPINLDVVKLNDIIDTDGSEIKIVNLNGKEVYAVSQTGDFESDEIEINGFTAIANNIPTIHSKFQLLNNSQGTRADMPTEVVSTYGLYSSENQNIDIDAFSIDESIISIDKIECQPSTLKLILDASTYTSITSLKFKRLTVNFIKGLQLAQLPSNCTYDITTGELSLTNLDCPNNRATINLNLIGVDMNTMGAKIVNRDLNIKQNVSLKSAEIETVTRLQAGQNVAQELDFTINTVIDPIMANSFTGTLKYAVDGNGLNISPIDLSDLPDFLNDKETDVKLDNPQIYLSITNPLASSNLKFQTGLEITSVHEESETTYPLDANQLVVVGTDKGVGPYNFVLSPANPAQPLEEYKEGLTHVGYAGLSNVLSGEGLPSQIKINLVDPELPQQKAENLPLYTKLPAFKGNYDFVAPLSLEAGSKIVYTTTEDGWGDKDLSKLTITKLVLTADVSNATPLNAKLTVVPLYKDNFDDESEIAKPIPGIKGETSLNGNSTDQAISVELSGEIKNLDGVKFTAIVNPASTDPMAPEQTITLKNVRVTVSGYYLTDFEDNDDE